MRAEELIPGKIYRTKSGDVAEFSRIGGTGLAVMHPPGEPDIQSCWAVDPSVIVVEVAYGDTQKTRRRE